MSSGSICRRSEGYSSGSNEDGDEEEEKSTEITITDKEKEYKSKKRRVFGLFGVGVRKGKRALLFRFRRFQKFFRSLSSASSNSESRRNSSLFGGGLCCACLSKPYVNEDVDSKGNVVPDDPEEFSYEHLKSMIEKNDFCSKECDTHFDD